MTNAIQKNAVKMAFLFPRRYPERMMGRKKKLRNSNL
jgi:hypothetical protein